MVIVYEHGPETCEFIPLTIELTVIGGLDCCVITTEHVSIVYKATISPMKLHLGGH